MGVDLGQVRTTQLGESGPKLWLWIYGYYDQVDI